MLNLTEQRGSNFALVLVFFAIVLYAAFIQFLSPVLYECDGYYHLAAARFLKDFGPHYNFRWAQFSTFKDFFSDKDFLLHVFTVPFLYLTNNIILAGKLAIICLNLWLLLLKRKKMSLSTLVWWGCSSVYLGLCFFGVRYAYAPMSYFLFFCLFLKGYDGRKFREAKFISR